MGMTLHDQDFFAWTQQQAHLLRTGQLKGLDISNLAEEIEDMGGNVRRQLECRLEVLLIHLLKWHFQPNFRGRSWALTIAEQRRRIAKLIRKNPSLQSELSAVLEDVYDDARFGAMRETGLEIETFPESVPYSLDTILDTDYLPD